MYPEHGLPLAAVMLAPRLGALRRRQGKKQSDISRRLGIDPSIPSLWEQGKRPVPPTRLAALADALDVSLTELLEGVAAPALAVPALGVSALLGIPSVVAQTGTTLAVAVAETPATPPGWATEDGLGATDGQRQEGLWLDAGRIERPAGRAVLWARLCALDRDTSGARDSGGAALAERIAGHCSRLDDWTKPAPVAEALFRAILGSDRGGLPVNELVLALAGRVPPSVAISGTLIRRLGPSLRRAYPVRWVARGAAPAE